MSKCTAVKDMFGSIILIRVIEMFSFEHGFHLVFRDWVIWLNSKNKYECVWSHMQGFSLLLY